MIIRKIKENEYSAFLKGMNEAFKERRTEHIPYSQMKEEAFLEELENGMVAYGVFDDSSIIIGGCAVKESSAQADIIKHVWVYPAFQGKGIAKMLLKEVEQNVSEYGKVQSLQLCVASNYEPALRLYRKLGYKSSRVYANVPKTYHFIEMVKPVHPHRLSEVKRILQLFFSVVKFRLLFSDDSTPNLIHRFIYERDMC